MSHPIVVSIGYLNQQSPLQCYLVSIRRIRMDIDLFYQKLASVMRPRTYYRSHIMHVSIPQKLDGAAAQKILQAAEVTLSEAMALIREQLALPDAARRVGENNLDNTYDVFDRTIGEFKG